MKTKILYLVAVLLISFGLSGCFGEDVILYLFPFLETEEDRRERENAWQYEDNDEDGLTNVVEITTTQTDLNNPDTDGDGMNDGDEYEAGRDPLTPDNGQDDPATRGSGDDELGEPLPEEGDITAPQTPPVPPESNLETYTDQEVGFTFRYPVGWQIESATYNVGVDGERATYPTILIGELGDTQNNFIALNLGQAHCIAGEPYAKTNDYVGGLGGRRYDIYYYWNADRTAKIGGCLYATFAAKDNAGKAQDYWLVVQSAEEEARAAFEEILSSFQLFP